MSKLNQWCVLLLCDSHVIDTLSWEPRWRWIDRSSDQVWDNILFKWHSATLILWSNDQLQDRDWDCPISIPYQSLPVCLYGCTWLKFPLDYGDCYNGMRPTQVTKTLSLQEPGSNSCTISSAQSTAEQFVPCSSPSEPSWNWHRSITPKQHIFVNYSKCKSNS